MPQGGTRISETRKLFLCFLSSSLCLFVASSRLELGVVESLVGPVIRHHFVDVILRLRKPDLSYVSIRLVRTRASDPARQIIGAPIVRTRDRLRLIRKLLEQVRKVMRPKQDCSVGVVKIVLIEVPELEFGRHLIRR